MGISAARVTAMLFLLGAAVAGHLAAPLPALAVSQDDFRAAVLPHATYLVNTGECEDCHSTHRPTASDIRVVTDASRIDTCTYCHAGGGGSSHVIAMDATGPLVDEVTGEESPWGVGHSLGSRDRAPDDVKPAYMSDRGMDCFSCHTPHLDSARLMTTFYSPRVRPVVAKVTAIESADGKHRYTDPSGVDVRDVTQQKGIWWGVGKDTGILAFVQDGHVTATPFYPTGRFMLLSDPHATAVEGRSDASVSAVPGSKGQSGSNKVAVRWRSNEAWDPRDLLSPGSPNTLTLDAVCVDCHDGAAGTSVSRAVVWEPGSGDTQAAYKLVYEHDCRVVPDARAMRITSTGLPDSLPTAGTDNYGPKCSVCHSGGSACGDCHTADSAYHPEANAWDRVQLTNSYAAALAMSEGRSIVPAVTIADLACIDSGMNWPHRTLGVAMLKNSLYGIDFDGTQPTGCGDLRETAVVSPQKKKGAIVGRLAARSEQSVDEAVAAKLAEPELRLIVRPAENIDAVCIDCHGDASYWRGEDATADEAARGFRVHLKGLP